MTEPRGPRGGGSAAAPSRNVEFDGAARQRLREAQDAFRAKRDAGTVTPDDVRKFLDEISRFGADAGWNTPEVKELLRQGRYRARGFVILDEVGYDRELAKRSVGPGWASLVDEAFDYRDRKCPRGRFVQVKEKWGALVMYVEGPHKCVDGLFDFVDEIERRSTHVCEECGAPGVRREGAWILTRCDTHAAGHPPLVEIDRSRRQP